MGIGKLTRNAIQSGTENKAITFTVVTEIGYDENLKRERTAYVPCVFFNPPEEIRKQLVEEGVDLEVDFEGTVNRSSYKKDGVTKFNTEVIIDPENFNILTEED